MKNSDDIMFFGIVSIVLGALGYRRTMSEDFGNAWGLEWPEFWVTKPTDGGGGDGLDTNRGV